jgi:hypothetical protein
VKDVCDHKAKWDQTDIIVDVRTYSTPNLREDLKLCFEIFQKTCSKRNSIEPFQWPSIFYFLTAIGIVKSIMIDIQVLPLYYNCGPKQDMVYIQSTYNALVSIFAWATGPLEPLLADHSRVIIADRAATLQEMRKLIRIDHWAVWNIKSTRDFLMRLGEGYFFDGTFNGFIVQEQVLVHNFTEKDAGTVQLHHISSTIGRSAEKRRSQVDTMQDLLDMLPDGGKFDTDRPYSRVPLNTEAGDAALAQDTSSSTSASRVIFPKSKCSDCTEIESSEARSFRSFM